MLEKDHNSVGISQAAPEKPSADTRGRDCEPSSVDLAPPSADVIIEHFRLYGHGNPDTTDAHFMVWAAEIMEELQAESLACSHWVQMHRKAEVRAENAEVAFLTAIAALRPFAALATEIGDKVRDDACWCGQNGAVIRYGDIRRAARVLSALIEVAPEARSDTSRSVGEVGITLAAQAAAPATELKP